MVEIEKLLNYFTPIAVAIGAVLGYLVKLRWSREFEKTLEARVAAAEQANASLHQTWEDRLAAVQDAMKAQLEAAHERALGAEQHAKNLLTFSPEKIKNEFSSMKSYYEEQLTNLKAQLRIAEASLANKEEDLKSQQAASERVLRDRLNNEKKSYEDEVSFLKAQIEDLQGRERVLVQTIHLLQKKPFEEDLVRQRLKRFSADRTLAKIKYEQAQQGVYASEAAYRNAQATAQVEAEKKEERKLAKKAGIPIEDDRDT